MSSEPVLVTISFSHYCEKARWALDRAGIAYREEAYAPVAHLAGTVRRGGRSTPMLVLPEGRVLKESTDIVHWVDGTRRGLLYTDDPTIRAEVEALEKQFDDEVGPHARRLAYHALLGNPGWFTPALRATTTGVQRTLAPVLARIVPRMVKRGLRIDDAGAARSRVRLEAALDRVEALLADGRRYLAGDRFTAADLTFAALYAAVVNPPEQPVMCKLDAPPSYAVLIDESRRRPAGQFVLRLYAEERARVCTPTGSSAMRV